MRIILLGPPGSGKGTQAQFLCDKLRIPKISTGDILRAEIERGSSIGQKVKKILESGQLVDDKIVIEIIKNRLSQKDCEGGFLFDGFPRTVPQAEALEEANLTIDRVIYFDVPDEVIITRLSGRRTHLASGRVYHLQYNPPKTPDCDDVTGEPLVQRNDDKEEVLKNRLLAFHRETEPLKKWYQSRLNKNFYRVLAIGTIDRIHEEILNAIG